MTNKTRSHGTLTQFQIMKYGSKLGGSWQKFIKIYSSDKNIERPNARQNTVVIAIAAVRDSHENIVRFLKGELENELTALQSHSWRDKTIRSF